MGKKVAVGRVNTTHSDEHGEVKRTSEVNKVTQIFDTKMLVEPPYVKMYLDQIAYIRGIPASLMDTMYALLLHMGYDGYITLSARLRTNIAEKLGISKKTLSNRIAELINDNLMTRSSPNDFLVNPDIFGKGSWSDIVKRKKEFKIKMEFSAEKGRTVQTEVIDSVLDPDQD